jgi:CRP-like cAMP-binding protein
MRKVLYLLGQLSDSDLEWLIAAGTRQRVHAGTILIEQGKPVNALYIVLDGTLGVSFGGGRPPTRLGCGEVVGEISFVDSRPPSATVTALEDAVLLALSRRDLAAKLEADPAFAARFYRFLGIFLAHRLRELERHIATGGAGGGAPTEVEEDELDPLVLDHVHMAGSRFERVLQQLLGE